MSKAKTVVLDVREMLRNGREPFSVVMQTVADLAPDQDLQLIAPFEPVPLFHALAAHGLGHEARELEGGDWEIRFSRRIGIPSSEGSPNAPRCTGTPVLEVDARGLEPPQPMVRILEALTTLPPGARLRARTDRRPMHLYAQLEQRGFTGQSEPQEDGSFVTEISRA